MKWVSQGKRKKKYSIKRFFKSFKYAFSGIGKAYNTKQNLVIHTIVLFLILNLSWYLKISNSELMFIVLAMGLVFALELVNAAIENTVDMAMPNMHPLAKNAKDMASAAVLVSSLMAIIINLIIFVPKIIDLF